MVKLKTQQVLETLLEIQEHAAVSVASLPTESGNLDNHIPANGDFLSNTKQLIKQTGRNILAIRIVR